MFPWNDPLFDPVIFVTDILSTLVLSSQVLLILGVLGILIHLIKPNQVTRWCGDQLGRYGHWMAFIVTTTAMAGSLYYSEVAQYIPCNLCWYQRIAIFPLPFLLAMDLVRRSKQVFWYILPQVIIGLGISIYHYVHQIWKVVAPASAPDLTCGVVGMTPSCSGNFFLEYGYITIPMMSMTTLLIVLFLAFFVLRYNRQVAQTEVK